MKTLCILRHAKSSWNDPDLSDHERPLNDRGKKAAPFMGRLIADRDITPDVIVSSPAVRAKTTAELVKESAHLTSRLKIDDRIYEASPLSLQKVVSEIEDDAGSAMIVGHNPGIEGFIRYLTGRQEPMPTAALAVIRLNIDRWADVSANSGELRRVIRPREEMRSLGATS
jgi:phosphohistidine phosphatase